MAMAFRLDCFARFFNTCLQKNEAKIDPFIDMTDSEVIGVADALLEAAAVVPVGGRGFSRRKMFAEAARRAAAAKSEAS